MTATATARAQTSAPATSALRQRLGRAGTYVILIVYSLIAVFPVALILINSFKDKREVFSSPYSLPNPINMSGYETVFGRANVIRYFGNSLAVTLTTIILVLLFGAMAAYALSEYRFFGNRFLAIYFALGIMIPVRLGTVSLIRLMKTLNLHGTLGALILVYAAAGLPISIFILHSFMHDVPRELKDAARVDGASEYRILFQLVMPLVRPALATVAVFHMIPVWNDLWWPLVLASGESVRTITLGISWFVGQFKTDWSALLASLSLAMMPVLILYALFSRQLIRGLSEGAVKL
ncbi:MAG: carbohydrate ABC transporter permease [Anaerolineae bacterium]|nr:carbohydrate ABC transporter permease [Anaerolineae bacterium]